MHWQEAIEMSPRKIAMRIDETGTVFLRYRDGLCLQARPGRGYENNVRPDRVNGWMDWKPVGDEAGNG